MLAKAVQMKRERRVGLYTKKTSQLLLDNLLGGVAMADAAPAGQSPADRAISGGPPAVPATLRVCEAIVSSTRPSPTALPSL